MADQQRNKCYRYNICCKQEILQKPKLKPHIALNALLGYGVSLCLKALAFSETQFMELQYKAMPTRDSDNSEL